MAPPRAVRRCEQGFPGFPDQAVNQPRDAGAIGELSNDAARSNPTARSLCPAPGRAAYPRPSRGSFRLRVANSERVAGAGPRTQGHAGRRPPTLQGCRRSRMAGGLTWHSPFLLPRQRVRFSLRASRHSGKAGIGPLAEVHG